MGMVIDYCIIIRDIGVKVWFHDQHVGMLGSLGEFKLKFHKGYMDLIGEELYPLNIQSAL